MANLSLPLDQASLVSIWLESILYGAVIPLFCFAVYIILHNRDGRGINKSMLLAATLMTLLATVHIFLNLARAFLGFIDNEMVPNGPNNYFNQLNDKATAGKFIVFTLQTVVGDMFNIYRLYMVWNRSWRVLLLPALIFVGSITTSAVSLSFMLTHSEGSVSPPEYNAIRVDALITAFLALLTLQPLVTSSLIGFRLVRTDRLVRGAAAAGGAQWSLLPVVRIVLDSAGAYVATMLTMVLLFVSANTAFFIVMEAVVPIVAITFCSIITRVASHASKLQSTPSNFQAGVSQPARQASHVQVAPERVPGRPRNGIRPDSIPTTPVWYGKGSRSRSGSPEMYAMPVVVRVSTERLSGIPDGVQNDVEADEWEPEEVKGHPFASDV